ncbi:DUF2087 domain-containing protein [Cohnella thermotolerans]|uniref:DUF2087 domain-containing protein n=1 Tax=Cohnella thermotolerans TaxID=329858 RepID=UPI00146F952A|nr:DUF2087 domain-containing protein [Cohnella thermotolerans]
MTDQQINTSTLIKNEKLRKSVLSNFFENNGRLKHLPSKLKKRLIVLEYLTNQLDTAKTYSELELNEIIKAYHDDYATIRRELFIHKFVNRENGIYVVNNREDWRDWVTLN